MKFRIPGRAASLAALVLFACAPGASALDALPLPTLDGSDGFRMVGEGDDDVFGLGVDGIGDFNADGIDDFLVAAEFAESGGTWRGAVYVVYGTATGFPASFAIGTAMDGVRGFRIHDTNDYSGQQVAAIGAGDLNDDGKADIAIGFPFHAGSGVGRTCVVFGRRNAPPTVTIQSLGGANGFCVVGQGNFDNFGRNLGRLGDFDKDGIDDLAIGAFLADNNGTDSGSVYVLFGDDAAWSAMYDTTLFDGQRGFRIDGALPDDRIGTAPAGGDLNGDGFSDLVVGHEDADDQGYGGAFVVFGTAAAQPATRSLATLLDGAKGFRVAGESPFGWFGRRVSTGDLDGDGIAELVAGAFFGGIGGHGYVLRGHAAPWPAMMSIGTVDGTNGFRIDGTTSNDRLGEGAAYVGDLNGDGIGDAAFGAPYADPAGAASGSAYVAFGTTRARPRSEAASSLRAQKGFRLDGAATESYCGIFMARAGDVNDDGLDDAIFGCHYAPGDGVHRGEAYVVFGNRAPMVQSPDAPVAGLEDAPPAVVTLANLAADYYLDAQPMAGAAITTTPPSGPSGRWEYRATSTGAFSPIPAALGRIDALVVGPTAEFRFVPGANFNGASVPLALRFWDGAGSAVVGPAVDVSDDIGSFGGFAGDADVLRLAANVLAVNDAPTFAPGQAPVVPEDAGTQVVAGWASVGAGAPDESGQAVTLDVTGNTNAALFSIAPAVSPNGTLSYTPAANASGTATITVVARDDGGTANGGVDTAAARNFVVTVTAVDDPGVAVDDVPAALLEDGATTTFAVLGNDTDIDGGPLAVSAVTQPASGGSSAVGPAGANVAFTPAADFCGATGFTYTLAGGSTGNVAVTVACVNDAPAFTPGPDPIVQRNSGARAIAGWATGIGAGAVNESAQTISFDVTHNSNPALFGSAPVVAADGTLAFTPAADAQGMATITLVARDDGGTADGGVDTSAARTFRIFVVGPDPLFGNGFED